MPNEQRLTTVLTPAALVHNPHIHRPSRADFAPGPPIVSTTPFAPPPPAALFPRSLYLPSTVAPVPTAREKASGNFSLSLRGLRKQLRATEGGAVHASLALIERELRSWLSLSGPIPPGYFHNRAKVIDPTPVEDWLVPATESLPDLPSSSTLSPPPPSITELSRSAHALVWLVISPHTRYLLHVLARYYNIQSFSRALSPLEPDVRVTHILRPNWVRPEMAHIGDLETPPGTDWSDIGATTGESESEVGGATTGESESEVGGATTDEEGTDNEWEAVDTAREVGLAQGVEPVSSGWTTAATPRPESVSGGTDDEASTDGEDFDGGVDSLASSIAELPLPSSIPPTDPSSTPLASRISSTLAFISSPSGTTTPTQRTARVGRTSLPRSTRAATRALSESPSRSPVREAQAARVHRAAFAGGPGWEMPTKSFVDFLFL